MGSIFIYMVYFFFLFGLDKDILLQTKSKIPNDFFVESNWISGANHTRKQDMLY